MKLAMAGVLLYGLRALETPQGNDALHVLAPYGLSHRKLCESRANH